MQKDYLLESLKIDSYFALAQAIAPACLSLSIVSGKDLLNTQEHEHLSRQQILDIHAHVNLLPEHPSVWTSCSNPCGNGLLSVYVVPLKVYTGTLIGNMIFIVQGSTTDSQKDEYAASLARIAELIIGEYELNLELESSTLELTNRYEELNLIFGTEDNAEHIFMGQVILQNLVEQCTERMGVDAAILHMPDQDITIVNDPGLKKNVLGSLQDDAAKILYPWTREKGESFVINGPSDDDLKWNCPSSAYKLVSSPIHGYGDEVGGVLAVLNKVSKTDFSNSDRNLLQILSRKVSRIIRSNYDELTGLPNKTSFEHILDEFISHIEEDDRSHSLLLIDLRGLHVLNDISGNEAGDALIKNVAALLKKESGIHHTVSRIEGDVFAVLLDDTPVDDAIEIATELKESLNLIDFRWNGQRFYVNVCMGLVTLDSKNNAETAVSSAKIALQVACEKGNNLLEVQRVGNDEIATRKERIRMLGKINQALKNNRFELFCQGIYSIRNTNEPHHYEVLLRMLNEKGQLVSPFFFMPAAEHYKVMPDIDKWVIHSTLSMLDEHWDILRHTPQSWAINLSGQTFSQPNLLEFISAELAATRIPAHRIAFEVTETVAVENMATARVVIESIQALGCEFYLDDFGTGLSSFTYLLELPFDHVKIDGSFIKNVVDDPVARAMVKAIADVAKVLGIKTVAEYVETDHVIRVLDSLGVEYLQGFGLHKPVSISTIIDCASGFSKNISA